MDLGVLCGVDIIEIDRVRKAFETGGQAFRDRIFTRREIEYCESKNVAMYKSYAARFAAKEAVSKALGTGIGSGIGWKDIEIFNDVNGRPCVSLTEKLKDMLGRINAAAISLSLSHSDNHAVAFAVIQTDCT